MRNLRYQVLKYVMMIVFTFYAGMSNATEDMLNVSVDRTWGLVLGDDLTVRVDLSELSVGLDKSSLPQVEQRYGTWLYLRDVEQTADQLALHYLIVNVPIKNTTIDTPKFDVKQTDEKWLTIPAQQITIGPSLAVEGGVSNIDVKPDMKPTLIATIETENQLKLAGIIAAVSLLMLALWHFGWKTKNRQPFAQAVHELSRFKLHTVTADEAARVLHTAFNSTAGTVVVYGKLDGLFVQHSWLQPLQAEIEAFYQQSEQHFFARNSQQGPDIDSVRKLAKACRSKEMLA